MRPIEKTLFSALLGVALLAFAQGGCGRDNQGAKPEGESGLSDVGLQTVESWAAFALNGYAELGTEAQLLQSATEDLCAVPAVARLEKARAAYDEVRRTWQRLRTFGFGPEVDVPLRLGPKIDYQPPRPADIEKLLAAEGELPEPPLTGAQTRGLTALEHMLFGARSGTLESGGRDCKYLVGVARDLVENTKVLHDSWSESGGDFVGELLRPSKEQLYFETHHQVLSGLVNRMGYVVENQRDQKIEVALGAGPGEEKPELVTSRLSNRTLDDLRDEIAGLEALYWGTSEAPGLSGYGKSEGVDLDVDFLRGFAAVRDQIDALEPSFEAALVSDREGVESLDRALEDLQLLYQIDTIGRLSLSQIFNDADGD